MRRLHSRITTPRRAGVLMKADARQAYRRRESGSRFRKAVTRLYSIRHAIATRMGQARRPLFARQTKRQAARVQGLPPSARYRTATLREPGPRLAKVRMANQNRHRKNQPPTGEGKHQSRYKGEPRKLGKRSDVLQAQRGHPELNLGDSAEEAASREGDQPNPKRPKAGR